MKNKKLKIMIIIFSVIVIGILIYFILGGLGLLPSFFYDVCKNISVETAMKRGCCEDRTINHPVSWLFGADNCDSYRLNETVELGEAGE